MSALTLKTINDLILSERKQRSGEGVLEDLLFPVFVVPTDFVEDAKKFFGGAARIVDIKDTYLPLGGGDEESKKDQEGEAKNQ